MFCFLSLLNYVFLYSGSNTVILPLSQRVTLAPGTTCPPTPTSEYISSALISLDGKRDSMPFRNVSIKSCTFVDTGKMRRSRFFARILRNNDVMFCRFRPQKSGRGKALSWSPFQGKLTSIFRFYACLVSCTERGTMAIFRAEDDITTEKTVS